MLLTMAYKSSFGFITFMGEDRNEVSINRTRAPVFVSLNLKLTFLCQCWRCLCANCL